MIEAVQLVLLAHRELAAEQFFVVNRKAESCSGSETPHDLQF